MQFRKCTSVHSKVHSTFQNKPPEITDTDGIMTYTCDTLHKCLKAELTNQI